jgi:hypothetical protein
VKTKLMLNRSNMNWKLYLTILPLLAIAVSCNKTVDPEIKTLAVTEIGSDQATFNGNLISYNLDEITKYGFCYGTAENPTTSDLSILFGPSPSPGEYSTTMDDLASETIYYVRACVISDGETFYGNQISFTSGFSTSLAIGDTYAGGEVAYIATPGDLIYVEGEEHGFVVATTDQSSAAVWGCSGVFVPSAEGEVIGTGQANTSAIITECGTAGIAAEICSNLTSGGYSDWFLPSINELAKIQFSLNEIPSVTGGKYFSSTQVSSTHAKSLIMTLGNEPEVELKLTECKVRAIRYF